MDSAFATFLRVCSSCNLGRKRAQIFIRNRKDGGDKLARLAPGSSGSPSLSSFMRHGKSSEPLKGGLRVSGEKSLGKPGESGVKGSVFPSRAHRFPGSEEPIKILRVGEKREILEKYVFSREVDAQTLRG